MSNISKGSIEKFESFIKRGVEFGAPEKDLRNLRKILRECVKQDEMGCALASNDINDLYWELDTGIRDEIPADFFSFITGEVLEC